MVIIAPMTSPGCPPDLPHTPLLVRRCPDCGLRDTVPRGPHDPPAATTVVLSCAGCEPEGHTFIRFTDMVGRDVA